MFLKNFFIFQKADIHFLMIFYLLIVFTLTGIRSYTQTGENEFRTFTREEGELAFLSYIYTHGFCSEYI